MIYTVKRGPRLKLKFKNAAEIESFLDPRNKIFVDWTSKTIEIRGPHLD